MTRRPTPVDADGAVHAAPVAAPRPGVVRALTDLRDTLRVRAFRLHLGMYLGGYVSQDIFNATFTFFVIFALGGSTAGASGLLGSMYVVQLFAVALAIRLVLAMGPARAYRLAAAAFALGVIVLLGGWRAGIAMGSAWVWIGVGAAGLGRGMLNYIPWASYNYMADVDEIMTGRRRDGSFAGVMTFVRKATQAVAVAGAGLALEAGGFRATASSQHGTAMLVLALILGLGTILLLAAGALISRRFRLDVRTHQVLMAEIEHLRTGAATPSSPAARAIVEDLSGCDYARLWGRGSAPATQGR
ncbi:MFS transporter [Novosphingobium capsulatum]|uniref:MFS transporter n=1 Tax=Novosphingobium capsulatum TaxID=13688 RepID=UPI000A03F69C|nr:MFS transporter [Novosphingobium capsulatum]WQD91462.1 MFS transporter [Novosphingobium capsulatum]